MILKKDILAQCEQMGATMTDVDGIQHIKFPHQKPIELANFLLCVGNRLMKRDLIAAIQSCRHKRRSELI